MLFCSDALFVAYIEARLLQHLLTNLCQPAGAVVRRAKTLDRKHDIPYLADYSKDGKTIYIDRHMPSSFRYDGRDVNTDRYLILHEEVEKTLIDQLTCTIFTPIRSPPAPSRPRCAVVIVLCLSSQ
jgi:hypothetical protein